VACIYPINIFLNTLFISVFFGFRLDRRQKRGLVANFLFLCTPNFVSGCNTQKCRNTVITALQSTIAKTALNNIPVTITSSGVLSTNTYTLTLSGFSTTSERIKRNYLNKFI
jgi:hypothetical protein